MASFPLPATIATPFAVHDPFTPGVLGYDISTAPLSAPVNVSNAPPPISVFPPVQVAIEAGVSPPAAAWLEPVCAVPVTSTTLPLTDPAGPVAPVMTHLPAPGGGETGPRSHFSFGNDAKLIPIPR
jgi:hypothetical protein